MNQKEIIAAASVKASDLNPKPKSVKSLNDLTTTERLMLENAARTEVAIEVFGGAILNYLSHPDRSAEDSSREIAARLFQQDDLVARRRDLLLESLKRQP